MSEKFDEMRKIMNEENCLENKQESKIKKAISKVFFGFLYFIIFIVLLFFGLLAIKKIKTDFIYSIPKPDIYGYIKKEEYGVSAFGLKVYTKEDTSSLSIVDFYCDYSTNLCKESITSAINLNGIFLHSYRNEYKINYKDKNKIYFSGYFKNISGEVNLLTDEIVFYSKDEKNKISELKIITNNSEIEKCMKKIIRKSLRNKFI